MATVLETTGTLVFGETSLLAGRYSLWARKVSSDEWRLIFNSEADIWGTDRKAENDVAEIAVEKSELPESVEQFTLALQEEPDGGAALVMTWGTLQLKADFTASE